VRRKPTYDINNNNNNNNNNNREKDENKKKKRANFCIKIKINNLFPT
jgi:hypothetical protein